MLYQMILRSERLMSDQEFHEYVKKCFYAYAPLGGPFKIEEARSLDGIREEVYRQPTAAAEIAERMEIAKNIADRTYKTAYELAAKKFVDDLSDLL